MTTLVEVLTFEGCPHADAAVELAERIVIESGIDASVKRVNVSDDDDAETQRFLGSPTIRVDGRDIEPGVEDRGEYVLSCRVYKTERGLSGAPEERWLRDALGVTE